MNDKTITWIEELGKNHNCEVEKLHAVDSDEVFRLLEAHAEILCDWLRKNFDPYTRIEFTCNGARIVVDEFSVPYCSNEVARG